MFKPLIVATAALAIGGSSIVYAQQHFGGGDGAQQFDHQHKSSPEDMAAFTDARIAALKAGLQLTPDQAKSWPAFEQALRDMAQLRMQRTKAHEAADPQAQAAGSPFDRLAERADGMSKVGAALKHVADAGGPLYQSLTDAQKHRFKVLASILRPHHHHHMHAFNEHDGHGWRQGDGRDGDHGGYWRGHEGRQFGHGGEPGDRMRNLTGSDDQGADL